MPELIGSRLSKEQFDEAVSNGGASSSIDSKRDELPDCGVFTWSAILHWIKTGQLKGHWQLGVRACTALCQCILTIVLFVNGIDQPHTLTLAMCQMGSSISCAHQFKTGKSINFLARAFFSIVRVGLSTHLSICGRRYLTEECDNEGWSDVRTPFRALALVAAGRMVMNTVSLVLHYVHPTAGVTPNTGNEQLFYRGLVRALGTPLHLLRGGLKILLLTGTSFQRTDLEITINFVRALAVIPVASWSLMYQYRDTGSKSIITPPQVYGSTEPDKSQHSSVLAVV
mmetsp:Transcript_37470/g.75919  ORF Transcript_37470/g.75919 Transcript_37470/m.75919 type:complete len:284 (-) Transcript_37470:106-957(-)